MRILFPIGLILVIAAPVATAHPIPVGPFYVEHHDNMVWCETNSLAGLQTTSVLIGTVEYPADTQVAPSPGNVADCA